MKAIIQEVRSKIPDAHFEIPTISPAFIRDSYPSDIATPISLFPWNLSIKFFGLPVFRSVARCDATIIFDAVLFDRSLWNPLFNYLSTLRFALPWARRHGRPVIFYNVGVGPVGTTAGRRFLRHAFNAGDLFTFRDPDSFALAKEVGLPANRPTFLTADAAFNHQPSPPERVDSLIADLHIPANRALAGFNVNAYLDSWAPNHAARLDSTTFVGIMAEVADRMVERWNAAVVFFVTQHMDLPITRAVLEAMRHKQHGRIVSNTTLTPEDLQGMMGRMEFFFGMRLHSLILAVSQLTPIVGMVYQGKVKSLFSQIDLPEGAIPFSDFEADLLWRRVDTAWSNRTRERERLQPIIARLRALAAETATRTAELINC